jgi:phosphoribosyl 1,2-cyclic phosphodiesterase
MGRAELVFLGSGDAFGVKYHLDYQTLMAHRDRLGCRRLVLTHMHQDMLDRGAALGAELAEDLAVVVLE